MISPITLWRGESRTLELTITNPDDPSGTSPPVVLDAGTYDLAALEFEIKARVGGPDPALVSKTLANGGIVLQTQSGATIGKASILIAPGDLSGATTPAGRYSYDVVAVFVSGARSYVIKPALIILKDVVNQP